MNDIKKKLHYMQTFLADKKKLVQSSRPQRLSEVIYDGVGEHRSSGGILGVMGASLRTLEREHVDSESEDAMVRFASLML